MQESIHLCGDTEYNTKFPPRDAKKGYVARITGKAAGAVKFERDFLGSDCYLSLGDDGLYEVQTGLKKGGYDRDYWIVLTHPEHGLVRSASSLSEAEAAKVAALLSSGRTIGDCVEFGKLAPGKKTSDVIFGNNVRIRSAADAKQGLSPFPPAETPDEVVAAVKLSDVRRICGFAGCVQLGASDIGVGIDDAGNRVFFCWGGDLGNMTAGAADEWSKRSIYGVAMIGRVQDPTDRENFAAIIATNAALALIATTLLGTESVAWREYASRIRGGEPDQGDIEAMRDACHHIEQAVRCLADVGRVDNT